MKSPADISARLQRQWRQKFFRLEMLTTPDAWPKRYNIGLPSASDISTTPHLIREHVVRWRQVSVGEVKWREVNYRSSSEAIRMPKQWVLSRPSEWVRAADNRQLAADFDLLESLIDHAAPELHSALIVHMKLLHGRSRDELLAVLELAERLKPGDARGRPLRLLAGHGVDTKFFERHHKLLVNLLDSRFAGEVTEQGLHAFLDAAPDGEHWVLIAGLQSGLMPFVIQQVRSLELASLKQDVISANRILVVENRQCWHLLPPLEDTIAILGSGLDLDWLKAEWLDGKRIAYWGDMDTWGLIMLARARKYRPELKVLMMSRGIFEQHAKGNAVVESVVAGDQPPDTLNDAECSFYLWLLSQERGRLEQEFLPPELVREVLAGWE